MKTLKRILLIVVVIIAIPFVVALFVPKEMKAEHTIVINRPVDTVFQYIKFVRNQDHFGVWQLSDPNLISMDSGIDGKVGFKHKWKSEKLGDGTQTITKIVEGKCMETALDFGFGEPSTGYFETSSLGAQKTKVTWGIKGTTPYPWNFFSLFMDMSKDFEQGLKNLKKELETKS
jgi:hypothetical protein